MLTMFWVVPLLIVLKEKLARVEYYKDSTSFTLVLAMNKPPVFLR